MKYKIKKQNSGYTIVETMIAISVFIVVIMSGMAALLNANVLHQKSQDMRSIIDNLSFIMEDMSRNMRTGYNFRCYDSVLPWDASYVNTPTLSTPRSCTTGGAIVFENSFGSSSLSSDQWVYKIESQDGGTTYNVYKSIDGGQNFVQLNSSEIIINSISGFSVIGAEAPSGDTQQPFVIIRLVGQINYKNVQTPFNLETAVSQRFPDL